MDIKRVSAIKADGESVSSKIIRQGNQFTKKRTIITNNGTLAAELKGDTLLINGNEIKVFSNDKNRSSNEATKDLFENLEFLIGGSKTSIL